MKLMRKIKEFLSNHKTCLQNLNLFWKILDFFFPQVKGVLLWSFVGTLFEFFLFIYQVWALNFSFLTTKASNLETYSLILKKFQIFNFILKFIKITIKNYSCLNEKKEKEYWK